MAEKDFYVRASQSSRSCIHAVNESEMPRSLVTPGIEPMRICMIAGDNPHYVHSLVETLARRDLGIDLIGGDEYQEFHYSAIVRFLNLRGSQNPHVPRLAKIIRITRYYLRCLWYMVAHNVRVVHMQRFRFGFAEGVILVSLYKLVGKRVVYTAHNIQPKRKKGMLTRGVYYLIYRCVDHIICHTEGVKAGIVSGFAIRGSKVSVIHHGMNSSVPKTQMSESVARERLGIDRDARVLLLFGNVRPYKGYEVGLEALRHLVSDANSWRLLVVGGVSGNDYSYLRELEEYVDKEGLRSVVEFHTRHIPDGEIEIYFKAADVLLLPYMEGDFQSGVLLLAYSFGLPVIAADVGSFGDEVENGVVGYVFRAGDPRDLAAKINDFFRVLQKRPRLRELVMEYARERYSWDRISERTVGVYQRVLDNRGRGWKTRNCRFGAEG